MAVMMLRRIMKFPSRKERGSPASSESTRIGGRARQLMAKSASSLVSVWGWC